MLKQQITYTNFDGEEITETHYFNLTKAELMLMRANDEYLGDNIQGMIDAKDVKEILNLVIGIIKKAYGVMTPDKHFLKKDSITEEFLVSEAFSEFFVNLVSDENAAANFINAIVPKDIAQQAATTPNPIQA